MDFVLFVLRGWFLLKYFCWGFFYNVFIVQQPTVPLWEGIVYMCSASLAVFILLSKGQIGKFVHYSHKHITRSLLLGFRLGGLKTNSEV